MNIYRPNYEKFMIRAFSDYSSVILIGFCIISNLIFYLYQVSWVIIVIINLCSIFFFSLTPLKFVFYLKEIILKNDLKTIELTIYKFDKFIKSIEIPIDDVEIKIIDHWFQRHTTYDIKIIYKNKCIIKQSETKNWSINMFIEIKNQINLIKNSK